MVDEALDTTSCLRSIASGNDDAARDLVRHLSPLVLKIVRKYRPFRNDEEDLVQTVFMKIFSKIDQFSGAVPLEHWVSRIAVNTCLNEIERQRVRPELRHADLTEDQEQLIEKLQTDQELDPADNMMSADLVEKMLGSLDPKDRLVIRMMYLDGHSIKDIQKETGWSSALVRIRAFRARAKLKSMLEKLQKKESDL
jgi:RNA polymerase sigma factor (sigma-70 family)